MRANCCRADQRDGRTSRYFQEKRCACPSLVGETGSVIHPRGLLCYLACYTGFPAVHKNTQFIITSVPGMCFCSTGVLRAGLLVCTIWALLLLGARTAASDEMFVSNFGRVHLLRSQHLQLSLFSAVTLGIVVPAEYGCPLHAINTKECYTTSLAWRGEGGEEKKKRQKIKAPATRTNPSRWRRAS